MGEKIVKANITCLTRKTTDIWNDSYRKCSIKPVPSLGRFKGRKTEGERERCPLDQALNQLLTAEQDDRGLCGLVKGYLHQIQSRYSAWEKDSHTCQTNNQQTKCVWLHSGNQYQTVYLGQDKETKMLAQRHQVQYIFGERTALASQLRKRLRMHESHTACIVFSVCFFFFFPVFSSLQFKPITDSENYWLKLIQFWTLIPNIGNGFS